MEDGNRSAPTDVSDPDHAPDLIVLEAQRHGKDDARQGNDVIEFLHHPSIRRDL